MLWQAVYPLTGRLLTAFAPIQANLTRRTRYDSQRMEHHTQTFFTHKINILHHLFIATAPFFSLLTAQIKMQANSLILLGFCSKQQIHVMINAYKYIPKD